MTNRQAAGYLVIAATALLVALPVRVAVDAQAGRTASGVLLFAALLFAAAGIAGLVRNLLHD